MLKSNQATPNVLITESPDFTLWQAEQCWMMCIRTKKPAPALASLPFSQPSNGVSMSHPIIEPIYRCWFSPCGLNCESNNCSLCLCVRLCWGRGALWGTLDSQVKWLQNDFALLLSVTTFFLFILANVDHATCACLYYAQSIPICPWLKYSTLNDTRQKSRPHKSTLDQQTLTWVDNIGVWCGCVKWPISMVKPVNVGRWHHSAWVQETSDSYVSPVICFPVDKRRNLR